MPVHYSDDSAGPWTRRNATVSQTFPAPDYESMSKAELQALLKHMALPTTGNKPDLIERLREAE